MKFYHVTGPKEAGLILDEGFAGSWGDIGFGVYLYDDIGQAEAYAARGGWDQRFDPNKMVILEVEVDMSGSSHGIAPVDPHPEWPNPEAYDHVFFHEMDEDLEDARWMPDRRVRSSNLGDLEP